MCGCVGEEWGWGGKGARIAHALEGTDAFGAITPAAAAAAAAAARNGDAGAGGGGEHIRRRLSRMSWIGHVPVTYRSRIGRFVTDA